MSTEAQLKAISNSQLASGNQIPALKHRTVNNAIIEEMYDAQSRADVLAGVQAAVSIASGDQVLVIRSGQAYLLDSSEFGFVDALADLTDVSIPTPSNDQVLAYNTATSKWVAKDVNTLTSVVNISGTATTNALTKFTGTSSIGNSIMSESGSTITVNGDLTATGDVTGDTVVATGTMTSPTGDVKGVREVSLGTNPTTVDVQGSAYLIIQASTFNASTTLTFSNVSNLRGVMIRLNNTNANTITFAGLTFNFKSIDLPSGVSFSSNELTFPADTGEDYNIVSVSFDGGTVFDSKIEIA